jgi:hypothetical protein
VPVFKGSSTEIAQNNANVPMITVNIVNSVYMVIGTITLLKQFNPDYRNQFVALLAQYIRSSIALTASGQRITDLPVDLGRVLNFVEEFIEFSDLDKKVN